MNRVSHSPVKAKKARGEASADTADDFEAIEQAVMATPRGRWFLAEYLRRRQSMELKRLLDVMRKLEAASPAHASVVSGQPSALEGLRLLLAQTADELAHGLGESAEPTLPEAAASRLARLLELARERAGNNREQAQQSLMLLTDVLRDMLARLADMLGEPMPLDGNAANLPAEKVAAPCPTAHEGMEEDSAPPAKRKNRTAAAHEAGSGGQRRIVIHRHGHSGEIDIPLPEKSGESPLRATQTKGDKSPDTPPAGGRRPLVRIR